MTVYLLHFDRPISPDHTAQHYIGYTSERRSEYMNLLLSHFENIQSTLGWAEAPGEPPSNALARLYARKCDQCRRFYNAVAALCGAELVE